MYGVLSFNVSLSATSCLKKIKKMSHSVSSLWAPQALMVNTSIEGNNLLQMGLLNYIRLKIRTNI
jgi:hypothetical protein